MSEIIKFTGRSATPAGQAVPEVLKLLEQLIEEAKAGNILAMTVATVGPGRMVNTGWAFGQDPIWPDLIAAQRLLDTNLVQEWKGANGE